MKPKIAIAAGGNSGEYEISINSAGVIYENIDQSKYDAYIIHIKSQDWTYQDSKGEVIEVDKNDFSIVVKGEKITFDCVFIAIHGTPGEDGKLQGYFDLLGIPYTSCDLTTSALTFNKSYCNRVVSSFGVNTPKSVHLFRNNEIKVKEIIEKFSLPCFVKPNNGGSSVGMSKVVEEEELLKAVQIAFQEDDQVLIEEYIEGTELTCGIIQSKGDRIIFPVTEIVSSKEFFDFEAKYTEGMADEIVPARISDEISDECKRVSAMLYNKLNCSGLVRFDYIFKSGKFYFLEVNTVPGLSEGSIVPKMAAAMGMSLEKLYDMMIIDALKELTD
ncbi:MAG: D-alanine--D-alanine ligase [Bacteroidales bacterium]|nr:D-alanine--D-alanine ligase [Bacteroidales bacterium]